MVFSVIGMEVNLGIKWCGFLLWKLVVLEKVENLNNIIKKKIGFFFEKLVRSELRCGKRGS